MTTVNGVGLFLFNILRFSNNGDKSSEELTVQQIVGGESYQKITETSKRNSSK